MGRRQRFDQAGNRRDALKLAGNSACVRYVWHLRGCLPNAPYPQGCGIGARAPLPLPGTGIKLAPTRDGSAEQKSVQPPGAALTAAMHARTWNRPGAALASGLHGCRAVGWPMQACAWQPYATDTSRRIVWVLDPVRQSSNCHRHSPAEFEKTREA